MVRELNATHAEEIATLISAHETDLAESQQRFAELLDKILGEKNAEFDRLNYHKPRQLADPRTYQDRSNSQLHQELLQFREEMYHMSQLNSTLAKDLATTRLNNPTASGIQIHHPNNVRRAKDQRLEQPSWTHIGSLRERAGGLPTPKATTETITIIDEAGRVAARPEALVLGLGAISRESRRIAGLGFERGSVRSAQTQRSARRAFQYS